MSIDTTELRRLMEAATPGPWGIYVEEVEDRPSAIAALAEQVNGVPDDEFRKAMFLLEAGGRCPAVTGCGPTSQANAALIVTARNALPALLDAAEERDALKAEVARLREAMAIFADDASWRLGGRCDPHGSEFDGQSIAIAALAEKEPGHD